MLLPQIKKRFIALLLLLLQTVLFIFQLLKPFGFVVDGDVPEFDFVAELADFVLKGAYIDLELADLVSGELVLSAELVVLVDDAFVLRRHF